MKNLIIATHSTYSEKGERVCVFTLVLNGVTLWSFGEFETLEEAKKTINYIKECLKN